MKTGACTFQHSKYELVKKVKKLVSLLILSVFNPSV